MPFARPSLSTIKGQIAQDIAAAVGGADPLLRFSNLGIVGKALANLVNLLYGFLDWISRQSVPFTATDEFLEGWAGLIGVIRQPAVAATGTVTFTGTPTILIPAGTSVVRADGVAYRTNADVSVRGGGSAVVTVTAVVPAAASTLNAGMTMTLGSAIAGVQSVGSVTTALTPGADVEADSSLRSRMLLQYASPPQGGAATDYVDGHSRSLASRARGPCRTAWASGPSSSISCSTQARLPSVASRRAAMAAPRRSRARRPRPATSWRSRTGSTRSSP